MAPLLAGLRADGDTGREGIIAAVVEFHQDAKNALVKALVD